MTAATASAPTTAQSTRLEGAVAVAAALVGLAFANFSTTEGENGSASDFLVMAPLVVVLAVVLFLWVLPRTRPDGPAKVWLGVLSLLTFPAFWSGVPIVLGMAAVAAARRAGSIPWTVVGGLVASASLLVCVIG
jgi:surface polysaccharide O-acyltransferase-like enzyme